MLESPATETLKPLSSSVWRIEPQSFFSRHYDLYQDGTFITTLEMQFWREGCNFSIGGYNFTIQRPSLWADSFQLLAGKEVVCNVGRKFWSRRFELTSTEQLWILQPASWFTTTYQFLSGHRQVGRISRTNLWSRRRIANFEPHVPPPVQVLAIFLVLIIGQRQNNSQ